MFDDGSSLAQHTLDKKAVAAALLDAGTFATVLHIICLKTYGEDIYEVDPLELYIRLEEDFGVRLCEENENKLQAIILSTATDAFYDDDRVFRAVANTLIEGDPGFEELEDLTVSEIYWAVYEVELNHDEAELSMEIQRLIAKEVDEEADDTPGISELRPNYVLREMAEFRRRLYNQLVKIGIKGVALPPIS